MLDNYCKLLNILAQPRNQAWQADRDEQKLQEIATKLSRALQALEYWQTELEEDAQAQDERLLR